MDFTVLKSVDEVEHKEGYTADYLAADDYPFLVERVTAVKFDANDGNGNKLGQRAIANTMLRVIDGPAKNRVAFVKVKLCPDFVDFITKQAVPKEEFDAANKKMSDKIVTFMERIGVGNGPLAGEDDADKLYSYYNCGAWVGRQFVGGLRVTNDTNWLDLEKTCALNDSKKGLEALRKRWAKLESKGGATSGVATL